jgi:hypothetical protein
MKKLVILFALFALFSCSEESISPIDYDINGVWKGNGDFVMTNYPEPGKMNIEFTLTNGEFVQFSYTMTLQNTYFEDTYYYGDMTRRGDEIYIRIFNTNDDDKNKIILLTFFGKMSNGIISGTLLFVPGGDSGDFKLRK